MTTVTTKTQLVDMVASDTKLTKKQAAQAIDSLVARIGQQMRIGETVQIASFGVFERISRPAYTAHNPRNMKPIEVPASNRVKFRASKVLKATVNS
jgi:DNA-binding protein HU-beta